MVVWIPGLCVITMMMHSLTAPPALCVGEKRPKLHTKSKKYRLDFARFFQTSLSLVLKDVCF